MRASLNFNLPDDETDFQAALAGQRALTALRAIDAYCRSVVKHGESSDDALRLATYVRGMMPYEVMEQT